MIKKKRTPRVPANLSDSSLIYVGDNHYVDPATGMVLSRIGHIDFHGYERVSHDGNREATVHRLVYEAVHGPIPDGLVINHINSVRHDNHPDNLEAVTQAENVRHGYRMGRHPAVRPWQRGERSTSAKITDQQRDEIVRRAQGGERVVLLAQEFGISEGHTYKLIRRAPDADAEPC